MRVIIAGGTGLIGRTTAVELAARGDEVIVLSRRPERAFGLPAGTRVEGWDARSAGWASLADGADAIINLAGENLSGGRWTEARKRRIRDSRVGAGIAVLQAVERARKRPSVLIQASAVGYYGPRGDERVAETANPGDDFLGRVCVDWEASTAPVEDLGVRRCVTRTGVVLSLEGGALPRMLLPFRLFVGGRIGNGQQWLSWIHIADQARAILFLLDEEMARGVYNLTSPEPLSNADFARVVGQTMGRPAALPTPAFALRAVFGEMADILLTGQRAVPERLLQQGFAFQFPTARQALRNLLVGPTA
jgi:hypothetical protein